MSKPSFKKLISILLTLSVLLSAFTMFQFSGSADATEKTLRVVPGSEAEEPYVFTLNASIYSDGSGVFWNMTSRNSWPVKEIIYAYDFPEDVVEAKVTAETFQYVYLQVSSDLKTWSDPVDAYDGGNTEIQVGGRNRPEVVLDDYLGQNADNIVFVRFANLNRPTGGATFNGRLYWQDVTYTSEEDALENGDASPFGGTRVFAPNLHTADNTTIDSNFRDVAKAVGAYQGIAAGDDIGYAILNRDESEYVVSTDNSTNRDNNNWQRQTGGSVVYGFTVRAGDNNAIFYANIGRGFKVEASASSTGPWNLLYNEDGTYFSEGDTAGVAFGNAKGYAFDISGENIASDRFYIRISRSTWGGQDVAANESIGFWSWYEEVIAPPATPKSLTINAGSQAEVPFVFTWNAQLTSDGAGDFWSLTAYTDSLVREIVYAFDFPDDATEASVTLDKGYYFVAQASTDLSSWKTVYKDNWDGVGGSPSERPNNPYPSFDLTSLLGQNDENIIFVRYAAVASISDVVSNRTSRIYWQRLTYVSESNADMDNMATNYLDTASFYGTRVYTPALGTGRWLDAEFSQKEPSRRVDWLVKSRNESDYIMSDPKYTVLDGNNVIANRDEGNHERNIQGGENWLTYEFPVAPEFSSAIFYINIACKFNVQVSNSPDGPWTDLWKETASTSGYSNAQRVAAEITASQMSSSHKFYIRMSDSGGGNGCHYTEFGVFGYNYSEPSYNSNVSFQPTVSESNYLLMRGAIADAGAKTATASGARSDIYVFDFPNEVTKARAEVTVKGSYVIEYSTDLVTWRGAISGTSAEFKSEALILTPTIFATTEEKAIFVRVTGTTASATWSNVGVKYLTDSPNTAMDNSGKVGKDLSYQGSVGLVDEAYLVKADVAKSGAEYKLTGGQALVYKFTVPEDADSASFVANLSGNYRIRTSFDNDYWVTAAYYDDAGIKTAGVAIRNDYFADDRSIYVRIEPKTGEDTLTVYGFAMAEIVGTVPGGYPNFDDDDPNDPKDPGEPKFTLQLRDSSNASWIIIEGDTIKVVGHRDLTVEEFLSYLDYGTLTVTPHDSEGPIGDFSEWKVSELTKLVFDMVGEDMGTYYVQMTDGSGSETWLPDTGSITVIVYVLAIALIAGALVIFSGKKFKKERNGLC